MAAESSDDGQIDLVLLLRCGGRDRNVMRQKVPFLHCVQYDGYLIVSHGPFFWKIMVDPRQFLVRKGEWKSATELGWVVGRQSLLWRATIYQPIRYIAHVGLLYRSSVHFGLSILPLKDINRWRGSSLTVELRPLIYAMAMVDMNGRAESKTSEAEMQLGEGEWNDYNCTDSKGVNTRDGCLALIL